ncbi:STAS domain-containing protein [Thiolapillus sp.]
MEEPLAWKLDGALDLTSIPRLWPEMARRIRASSELTISLGGVRKTSSAALALLLQGLEEARKVGCSLRYVDIPDDLLALARVSNVEKLLLP